MTNIELRVRQHINDSALLADSTAIVIGVSGGSDSVALLHLLTLLFPDRSYTAVYVNHNLRPHEVATEQTFVHSLCRGLGIDFEAVSIEVLQNAKKSNRSVEDCARHMRYHALETVRQTKNAQLIAVGHTSDDQVEQFFIRLIRGTGLRGLGGMAPRRDTIIRPLLGLTKTEILGYLEEKGIGYCLDSSNTSRSFLRNRVRLDLLPVLEKDYNASIRRTVLNSMSVIQQEDDYLDSLVSHPYDELVYLRRFTEGSSSRKELCISTRGLLRQHPALGRRIIEKMFWVIDCAPTFKTIDSILHLAEYGRTGSVIHFGGNKIAIKTYDSLLFSELPGDAGSGRQEPFRFADVVTIKSVGCHQITALGVELELTAIPANRSMPEDGIVLDSRSIEYPLIVREAEAGETFKPLGAPGRKKVTRILSDKKIPRHLRYRFPVLVSGNRIIALLGLLIADDCKIRPDTDWCVHITLKETTPSGIPARE